MTGHLRVDRVDQLHVRLTYSHLVEGPAHDVFLLDVGTKSSTGFDESAYLDVLEPVLHAHGEAADACSVRVSRTHRSWSTSRGEAEIAVALATGHADTTDHGSTEAVRSAFRQLLSMDEEESASLTYQEAITEARLRVERAYGDVHADRLSVTDEEHQVSQGLWSVGLVHLPTRARFRVLLGFVDGDPRTAHIRRVSRGEVVDSVGTE